MSVAVVLALNLVAALLPHCAAIATSVVHSRHGINGTSTGFIRGLTFRHRLRICNAYPFGAAINVRRGETDLTGSSPLLYKDCNDYRLELHVGDRLEFLVDEAGAGIFAINELPNANAVLLLVMHRHDTLSTAVSFQSHVFATLVNPQIAVIDTYQGHRHSVPRIMDAEDAASGAQRMEDLRYSSAVAVNPGVYKLALVHEDGHEAAKSDLVALNRESYVVLRVGVDAKQGPSYDEELVVYPRSSVLGLSRSGSSKAALCTTLPILAATTVLLSLLPAAW